MPEYDKLMLIKNLTKLKSQFTSISSPAYGGLYLRTDAGHRKYQTLDESVDPEVYSALARFVSTHLAMIQLLILLSQTGILITVDLGKCPYSFDVKRLDAHERDFAQYQAWSEAQNLAKERLYTDLDGWIAPQLNIEEKRRQNRELLSMYIERAAGEKSPEEARRVWPFSEVRFSILPMYIICLDFYGTLLLLMSMCLFYQSRAKLFTCQSYLFRPGRKQKTS